MVDPELETGKRLPLPIGEHDDPSLDLTDGPVMVKVESSTRHFYIDHYKKVFQQFGVWVRIMVLNAIFNKISVISWRSVLLVVEIRVSGENHRPVANH
jgi:hypothetical protein